MSLHRSPKIDYVAQSGDLIGRQGYVLNIITGCKHGCPYCYARRMVLHGRLQNNKAYPYKFDPTFHPERLRAYGGPPKIIFQGDMGDVGGDWPWKCWFDNKLWVYDSVMIADEMVRFANLNPDHIILLLTKRPEWYRYAQWPDNVWCGFSATNNEKRSESEFEMRKANIPARQRWMSLEPWLDDDAPNIRNDLTWLVVGGLSGSNAQPVSEKTLEWLRDPDVEAKRFTKSNAMAFDPTYLIGNHTNSVYRKDLPREYPDEWRVADET